MVDIEAVDPNRAGEAEFRGIHEVLSTAREVATVLLPDHGSSRVATVLITVHPKARRQGIGATVLRALVPELAARGRTVVEGVQVGPDGEAWANSPGFRTVNATILQHPRFADADRSPWDVPVPEGYRVERWAGAAPDALVASYAQATNAIADSPRGEASLQERGWTVDLVREDDEVDHALGFTTVRSVVEVNQPVESLLEALAGVRR